MTKKFNPTLGEVLAPLHVLLLPDCPPELLKPETPIADVLAYADRRAAEKSAVAAKPHAG